MAGSINKVILVGRIGQDVKLNYMPSGQPVAEFSVATDESYKDREGNKVEKTEWHRVKVFGKTAEFCSNYLGKGRLVYIEGKIQTRSWEDQQGQKRYMTEVVVSGPGHCVQALDRGPDRGDAAHGDGQSLGNQAHDSQQPRGNHNSGRQASEGRGRQQYEDEASGMDAIPGDGMSDVPF